MRPTSPASSGRRLDRAAVGGLLLLLAGCASTPAVRPGAEATGAAVVQPLKDLSLVRERPPQPLADAAADPYRVPPGCDEMNAEIAALDTVLGPDVDARDADGKDDLAAGLLDDAVRGALGLPFRGILRRMSGAEARDRALARAILAGAARRSFLKGLRTGRACPSP